jgi:hypothetical protein
VPIVHTRAVRLTTRQLADTMPSSVAEIAADKDLLRAEFAMSTRTLEMKVDQLKGKGANQLLELGKSGNTVNHLRIELDALRERLHSTDEQLASESAALKVAEHALADRASELATLVCDLEQQSILSDGQKIEIVTLKTQVEALTPPGGEQQRIAGREPSPRCRADRIPGKSRGTDHLFAKNRARLVRQGSRADQFVGRFQRADDTKRYAKGEDRHARR